MAAAAASKNATARLSIRVSTVQPSYAGRGGFVKVLSLGVARSDCLGCVLLGVGDYESNDGFDAFAAVPEGESRQMAHPHLPKRSSNELVSEALGDGLDVQLDGLLPRERLFDLCPQRAGGGSIAEESAELSHLQ